MSHLTKEQVEEFKRIFKEEYNHEFESDEEAWDQASRLIDFFEILYEGAIEDMKRKKRLEKEPRGFQMEDKGYTCCVCYRTTFGLSPWYDKYGIKCKYCQKAVEGGVIPKRAIRNRDWYDSYDLQSKFGLHSATQRKMVREGKLKARQVENGEGSNWYTLYIKSENQDLSLERQE